MPRRPRVLFIDDGSDTSELALRGLLSPAGIDVTLRHPEEVSATDLKRSQLVVVDYFLRNWPERDDSEPARAPADGLAVASTLRSGLLPPLEGRETGPERVPPIAFALWSAHLDEATFRLPTAVRNHVFARENNLEWVFRREEIVSGDAGVQLASLAMAVAELPGRWPGRESGEAAVDQLLELLGLDRRLPWSERARSQLLANRPPVFELSERSHGLAIVRWLLHRVLPYPSFLLDRQYLAARLRIDELPDNSDAGLWAALEECTYRGSLAAFAGQRWWRAGVEHWLWIVTDGRSGDPEVVADLARSLGGTSATNWRQPVVVIDAEYRRSPTFLEVDEAVRLRPDDWPPFADHAYADRMVARNEPSLAAIVDTADRHLLDDPKATTAPTT